MKYEEPMKIWAMKEIKDVVNYELDNARKGQTTKLNFVCPHMFALVTMYFAFWYKNPQHRLERSFYTMWNLWHTHVPDFKNLTEPTNSSEV
jgi:hypothetical protein